MKKILIFGAFLAVFCVASVGAAVRDGTNPSRKATVQTQQRISTNVKNDTKRATVIGRTATTESTRGATSGTRANTTVSRTATNTETRTGNTRAKTTARTGVANASRGQVARKKNTSARAASDETISALNQTKIGAVYEQCKSAYFQCMDQFCQLKNDDYRRCSCSDRVIELANLRQNLNDTNTKLTEFTDNLSVVGLTAAQATAINTASDGENALTADQSASKALLQAIMNSIRGEDATVGGKMSDLDSINISFDTTNAFGITDSAQLVASYNGTALYSAVYPNCRTAVKGDCNDASLQRAVTAYLMAIEQDCNTVQTALTNKQKELKSAIREGSAMLDLARVENRKKHNSDDLTSCINNVEAAILSEEVCGADYHKCLDNGQFIDVSTGAPIAGVANFNELGNLLKFAEGTDAASQKLSSVPSNRIFVANFENKTKKFAADALDKCTEIADTAWQNYLDKALLDIYYAQNAKVNEIKQGCFDFISTCYSEKNAAITAAMQSLIEGADITLTPNKIVLTQTMCADYIDSCNAMFDNNIVAEYMNMQQETDTLAACRAVVQQCFTKYGGANYENFYNPYSGLFTTNIADSKYSSDTTTRPTSALDWFSLYEYDKDGKRKAGYKSQCAQEVAQIESCADKMEEVFGGLDSIISERATGVYGVYNYNGETQNEDKYYAYGWISDDLFNGTTIQASNNTNEVTWKNFNHRLRPSGVATQVYNQIIDKLQTDCSNALGKFVESQFVNHNRYGIDNDNTTQSSPTNICMIQPLPGDCYNGNICINFYSSNESYNENVCPKDYIHDVDTSAWGACLCWENGGRRSLNAQSSKCDTVIYEPNGCNTTNNDNNNNCSTIDNNWRNCPTLDIEYARVCPNCNTECTNYPEEIIPYGAE